LYPHDKPNELIKEGPFSFALFESPFTSVSTVSEGYSSLVSLVTREMQNISRAQWNDVHG
jgi:hypothetical protein